MSTLKDIEPFIGKKDLSKTAKENIVQIFCQLESDTPIETIVAKLLAFPQDVLGGYFSQALEGKTAKEKDEFVTRLIEKIEPIKFGHLFRAYHSFIRIDDRKRAFDLLFSKMETDLIKKPINKQIFQGLDKMIKECSFAAFLVTFDEEQKRNLNIFATFLLRYLDYNKSSELLSNITKFYDLNRLGLPKEMPVTIDAASEKVEKKAAPKKPPTFEEILAMAVDKHKEVASARDAQVELLKTAEAEVKRLTAELQEKNAEIARLRNTVASLESQGGILKDKLYKAESDIEKLQKEKAALERANADLQARLENIASGYGAAGQQEMDSLKGKLSTRLKGEFEKFAEIKSKHPDMDYYEILILILDEVQKTLKKNGIEI
ncbi:MAG: hypothetical protein FWH03_06970 [Firmicutes bacterium]|nr:hypothetical protein [Bacillota bacterium]